MRSIMRPYRNDIVLRMAVTPVIKNTGAMEVDMSFASAELSTGMSVMKFTIL